MLSPLTGLLEAQLITAPAASDATLRAFPKGEEPPLMGPGEAIAADHARQWTAILMHEDFAPSADVNFLPFPRELDVLDVVRARYEVDGVQMDIAHTLCVASLVVSTGDDERALPWLARAQRIANRVLAPGGSLNLRESGRDEGIIYGVPDLPRRRELPNWEDDLRWWCSPSRLGFIFLKGTGGVTRTLLSYEHDLNVGWFQALGHSSRRA